MTLDDWKSAYLQLDSSSRRELALWIVQTELGGCAGSSQASRAPRQGLPHWFKPAAVTLLAVAVVSVVVWAGIRSWEERQAALARQSEAERVVAEARRPRSPANLEFLRSQLGREATITGIPVASEVGMLYFAHNKHGAIRLNLMPTGVVLMQSAELEALVASQTELTATGVVSETPDGGLEMKIHTLGQLRYRGESASAVRR